MTKPIPPWSTRDTVWLALTVVLLGAIIYVYGTGMVTRNWLDGAFR